MRQERSKDAKRTTRSNVSAHRSPAQLPLRIISPIQGETTRSETRFERDLPETSTPQTEDRLYQGRLTRSRAAAKTGRQRVSKYFEEQFQEESEQSLPANERRKKRSALQRKTNNHHQKHRNQESLQKARALEERGKNPSTHQDQKKVNKVPRNQRVHRNEKRRVKSRQ